MHTVTLNVDEAEHVFISEVSNEESNKQDETERTELICCNERVFVIGNSFNDAYRHILLGNIFEVYISRSMNNFENGDG